MPLLYRREMCNWTDRRPENGGQQRKRKVMLVPIFAQAHTCSVEERRRASELGKSGTVDTDLCIELRGVSLGIKETASGMQRIVVVVVDAGPNQFEGLARDGVQKRW